LQTWFGIASFLRTSRANGVNLLPNPDEPTIRNAHTLFAAAGKSLGKGTPFDAIIRSGKWRSYIADTPAHAVGFSGGNESPIIYITHP